MMKFYDVKFELYLWEDRKTVAKAFNLKDKNNRVL